MRGYARTALLAAGLACLPPDHTSVRADSIGTVTPDSTAIVVFAGERRRVSEGVRLLNAGAGSRLFITGIDADDAALRAVSGLDDTDTLALDHAALNTYENGTMTRAWLRDKNINRVILVTSDFHMKRSLAILRHELRNLPVQVVPSPVASSISPVERRWERLKTLATIYLHFRHIPGQQLSI